MGIQAAQRDNHRHIKYISPISRDTWKVFAVGSLQRIERRRDGRIFSFQKFRIESSILQKFYSKFIFFSCRSR